MELNFQLFSENMKKSNDSIDLIKSIDNKTELIFANNFSSGRYTIVPKVFKYKLGKFYIKVDFNNSTEWVSYNEFTNIDGKFYGVFKNELELSKSIKLLKKGD